MYVLIVPHLFEEGYYYHHSFTNNKNFKKLGLLWMWELKIIDNCIFLTNAMLDKWTNKQTNGGKTNQNTHTGT